MDKSILEISANDVQSHYSGNNISYDDLVKFAEKKADNSNQSKGNQQNIVDQQGFYISQADYIEYQIAKREAIKRTLKRKKFSSSLWSASLWLCKTLLSLILAIGICWLFYLFCWSLQQTF